MIHLKEAIRKHIIQVLIFIIALAFLLVQFEKVNNWIFVQGPEELKSIFDGFGYFSIIIFLFLYVIANVLLTPSYPFVFASGIISSSKLGTVPLIRGCFFQYFFQLCSIEK